MPTRMPRLSRAILIIFCLLLGQGAGLLQFLLAETEGASYYAAPSGHPTGDGSIGNPWDLQTALSGPASVRPGDTIWLRGGTYNGRYTALLRGSSSAPIKVRSYSGEWAKIDDVGVTVADSPNILTVGGAYTWYWGFEITSSNWIRDTSIPGSQVRGGAVAILQDAALTGDGLKFINLVVHDTGGGFGLWKEATNAEIYGCVVYYNGWTGPDRGHGHGIYGQNLTGTKRVVDNIVFSNFSHGIQVFGSGAAFLDNITVQGNTFFDNGMPNDYQRNILVGGGSIAQNPRIIDNVLYYPGTAGQNLNVGYDPYGVGAANPVITGNYIVNGDNQFSPLNTNVTMTGNSFYSIVYGSIPSLFPSNLYSASPPGSTLVYLRPNQYEAGRANITVVNPSNASTISVDLSGVLAPGATYEIRNAQNFLGAPVSSGVYGGGSVGLPTTNPSAAMVGYSTPSPSGPLFNAFVVLTVSPGTGTPPPPTSTPVVTPPAPTPTPTPALTPTPTPTPRVTAPPSTPTPASTPTPSPRSTPPPSTPTPTPWTTPAVTPVPTLAPRVVPPTTPIPGALTRRGQGHGSRPTPRVVGAR